MDESKGEKATPDLLWFGNSAYVHPSLFFLLLLSILFMRKRGDFYIGYMGQRERKGDTRIIVHPFSYNWNVVDIFYVSSKSPTHCMLGPNLLILVFLSLFLI
jgi:hypothetical protein